MQMLEQRVKAVIASMGRLEAYFSSRTLDFELEQMINKYLKKKFVQRLRVFAVIMLAILVCLAVALKVFHKEVNDDLASRMKAMPVLAAMMYLISEKLKIQETLNPFYLVLFLPVLVVGMIEALLSAPAYTKMLAFCNLNLIISYLLKFSNINKQGKMTIIISFLLYAAVRTYLHSAASHDL